VVFEVYNLNGKSVLQGSRAGGTHSISLAHLPKGMYVFAAAVESERKMLRVVVK
jgi:hypothetical protein